MTSKDFKLIAKMLKEAPKFSPRIDVAKYFADELKMRYPKFNKEKFINAVVPLGESK